MFQRSTPRTLTRDFFNKSKNLVNPMIDQGFAWTKYVWVNPGSEGLFWADVRRSYKASKYTFILFDGFPNREEVILTPKTSRDALIRQLQNSYVKNIEQLRAIKKNHSLTEQQARELAIDDLEITEISLTQDRWMLLGRMIAGVFSETGVRFPPNYFFQIDLRFPQVSVDAKIKDLRLKPTDPKLDAQHEFVFPGEQVWRFELENVPEDILAEIRESEQKAFKSASHYLASHYNDKISAAAKEKIKLEQITHAKWISRKSLRLLRFKDMSVSCDEIASMVLNDNPPTQFDLYDIAIKRERFISSLRPLSALALLVGIGLAAAIPVVGWIAGVCSLVAGIGVALVCLSKRAALLKNPSIMIQPSLPSVDEVNADNNESKAKQNSLLQQQTKEFKNSVAPTHQKQGVSIEPSSEVKTSIAKHPSSQFARKRTLSESVQANTIPTRSRSQTR